MALEETGPMHEAVSRWRPIIEQRQRDRLAAREWDDDGRLISDIPFIDAGPGQCGRCGKIADPRTVAERTRSGRTWASSRRMAAFLDCLLALIDLGFDVVHPRRWPEDPPDPRRADKFFPPDLPVHATHYNLYDGIDYDEWEVPSYRV